MKNLPFLQAIGCALLCAALVLGVSACKDRQPILQGTAGGTYKITGTLLQDCGGLPLAGHALIVTFRGTTPLSGETGEIGYATTDSSGHFEITCDNRGRGSIKIVEQTGTNNYYHWVEDYDFMGGDGNILNLGNVYYSYSSTGFVHISFLNAGNHAEDTVMLGFDRSDLLEIWPIPSDTIIAFTASGQGQYLPYSSYPNGISFLYGLGVSGFDSAYSYYISHNGDAPKYNFFQMNVGSPCTTKDTSISILLP